MIHYDAPLDSVEEVRNVILRARRAAGFLEPLSMSSLSEPEAEAYRRLILAYARDMARVALSGEHPGPAGIGWASPESLAGELHDTIESVRLALERLRAEGDVERYNDLYRARPGTGAFFEALGIMPELEACILAPYAVGARHLDWRIYYKGEDECHCIGRRLAEFEAKGIRIV